MLSKKYLVVEPHPDDFILMFGGTAARASKEGRVYVVTLTGGGQAASSSAQDSRLKEKRKTESQIVDEILGTTERVILPYDTRKIWDNSSCVYNDMMRLIRYYAPDVVVATFNDRRHPDHMWLAEFIEPLLYQVGENIRLEEFGPPVFPLLWYGENPRAQFQYPNIFIDITDSMEKKTRALESQTSQIPILGEHIS